MGRGMTRHPFDRKGNQLQAIQVPSDMAGNQPGIHMNVVEGLDILRYKNPSPPGRLYNAPFLQAMNSLRRRVYAYAVHLLHLGVRRQPVSRLIITDCDKS